jgi:cytochrome P450
MDFEWPLFMNRMGVTWREGRKLLDGSLRSGAIMSYRQMMLEKTHEFLANLFATTKDIHAHIEQLVGCLPYIV